MTPLVLTQSQDHAFDPVLFSSDHINISIVKLLDINDVVMRACRAAGHFNNIRDLNTAS